MSTKRSRRRIALEAATAESDRRYPEATSRSRSQRIGFVAGAMWHREHPWAADVENTKEGET